MSDDPITKILIDLIEEYYPLEMGVYIDRHTELISIALITADKSRHDRHPHLEHVINISRRAIKHFVEERKDQLSKNHNPDEVLDRIHRAALEITEVILNFNHYEYQADLGKHLYTKHYPGTPSIRIICERIGNTLEICSIHFRKQQKQK